MVDIVGTLGTAIFVLILIFMVVFMPFCAYMAWCEFSDKWHERRARRKVAGARHGF